MLGFGAIAEFAIAEMRVADDAPIVVTPPDNTFIRATGYAGGAIRGSAQARLTLVGSTVSRTSMRAR